MARNKEFSKVAIAHNPDANKPIMTKRLYKVKAYCFNCGEENTVSIPFGTELIDNKMWAMRYQVGEIEEWEDVEDWVDARGIKKLLLFPRTYEKVGRTKVKRPKWSVPKCEHCGIPNLHQWPRKFL